MLTRTNISHKYGMYIKVYLGVMHVFGLCMTPYEAVMLDFMFIGSSRLINAVLNITVAQFTKNQRERLCSVCFDLISIEILYY